MLIPKFLTQEDLLPCMGEAMAFFLAKVTMNINQTKMKKWPAAIAIPMMLMMMMKINAKIREASRPYQYCTTAMQANVIVQIYFCFHGKYIAGFIYPSKKYMRCSAEYISSLS